MDKVERINWVPPKIFPTPKKKYTQPSDYAFVFGDGSLESYRGRYTKSTKRRKPKKK